MKKSFTYAPDPFAKMPKNRKLAVANTIYLTDTNHGGEKISAKEFKKRIKETEDMFLELFGGYTNASSGKGEFMSSLHKKIITENVTRVASFSTIKDFRKKRKSLEQWLLKKKKEWKQEAIAYEFEGDLYYL